MTTKTDIRRDAIREIDAARSLRAELANMTDDTDAIRDTLEGETDLPSVMRALLLSIDEDQVLVDGLDGLITVLKSRHDRLEARIEAKRGLIEQAMAIAERADTKSPALCYLRAMASIEFHPEERPRVALSRID